MSASAKKKLRKEQTAAQLTEKQLNEQKEAKKLKTYTSIFIAAIAIVIVAGLVIAGLNLYNKSGIVEKNIVAATVNGKDINSVELSYYYTDMINTTYNQWRNSYGENVATFLAFMGIDVTKPLSEQPYADGSGASWADHFVESALEQAQSDYLLYAAAKAEGFVMPDDAQLDLNNALAQLTMYASMSGYPDLDAYLRTVYGPGADEETYYAYNERSVLANAYYNAHNDNLVIDDTDIRAYEADRYNEFSSYSYATYHLSYKDYLTGGTEGEDGTMVYTEAEEQTARDAAKADAELLAKSATVEELDAAIAALPVNKDSENAKSTVVKNALYSTISTIYRDWLCEENRKNGDCKAIDYTVEGASDTNDFYVVLFQDSSDNQVPLANVRHLLVAFEGGTADELGNIVYSDEEKSAAKAEAEAILAEMTADGTVTEEEFSAKTTEKTDDTASVATGGLYEDIVPYGGVYMEEFENWATDPIREVGETDIIETVYGYHIMYYVGDDEMTYRDYLISNQIRTESMNNWYNDILATGSTTVGNTSRLNLDITLSAT